MRACRHAVVSLRLWIDGLGKTINDLFCTACGKNMDRPTRNLFWKDCNTSIIARKKSKARQKAQANAEERQRDAKQQSFKDREFKRWKDRVYEALPDLPPANPDHIQSGISAPARGALVKGLRERHGGLARFTDERVLELFNRGTTFPLPQSMADKPALKPGFLKPRRVPPIEGDLAEELS